MGVIILIIGFTSSYYMMIVIMLALMYDIVLLVILLLIPKILMILGVIYFVFSCEVGRTPIDLIERESELVSGFNTEFSGGEFVRFFLREYLRIIILLVMIVSSEIYMFLILYGIVM